MSEAVATETSKRILRKSSWKTLLKILVLTGIQMFAGSTLMVLMGAGSPEMTFNTPSFFPTLIFGAFVATMPLWWWFFVIDDYVNQIELLEKENRKLKNSQ
jgi:polyferredoxin